MPEEFRHSQTVDIFFEHIYITPIFLKWSIMTGASVSTYHSQPMIAACLMVTAISHRDNYGEVERLLQRQVSRCTLFTLPPRRCFICLGLTLPTLIQHPTCLRSQRITREQCLYFTVITVGVFLGCLSRWAKQVLTVMLNYLWHLNLYERSDAFWFKSCGIQSLSKFKRKP